MLEVVNRIGGSLEIMSNVDSRSHDKRRDHDHQNHSSHHSSRRRHSVGQEASSGKKRALDRVGSGSSNRPHPRGGESSNSVESTPSRSFDRKKRIRTEDDESSEDVWTEHKSSSGKIYYYNKRLDKSQWEKPEKVVRKRLKSSSHKLTESSSGNKSHSSTSSTSKKESHHHGDHHHTPSQTRHEKRSSVNNINSSSRQSLGGSSPSTTPVSSILSPTGNVPPVTPTSGGTPFRHSVSTHGSGSGQHMGGAPESPLMTSSVFRGVAHGPVTPIPSPAMINYNKGVVSGGLPIVPNMEMVSVHPSQHPIAQYSQIYTNSPAGKPLPQILHASPAPSTPSQLINNNNYSTFFHHPLATGAILSTANDLPSSSTTLQSPMSKLGHWVNGVPPNEVKLPDPESLQTLPHLPSGTNDILSKVLAERMWTGQFDGVQKQLDHTHIEGLSRVTVDHSYHCGQLARGLLSLECSRIKEVSRSFRLSDLEAVRETIEKR